MRRNCHTVGRSWMYASEILVVTMFMLAGRDAGAQTSPAIAWDETGSPVTGYAITIDGIRTNYGLAPLGDNGVCGCSAPVPFSGGRHTIVVTAYNSFGETPSAPLVVAPIANPGGPYSGQVGSAIGFNGSASSDPTGTITAFTWAWGDGTSATSSSPTATHVYASSGTVNVTLTVTDNAGATASAATTVTVAAPVGNKPPTVSLTSPINGGTFVPPANLSVTASAADTDGTVRRVDFYAGSLLLGSATAAPYSIPWTIVAAGTYSLHAAAVDNAGATTSSAVVSVTATSPTNHPPAANDDTATVKKGRQVTIEVLTNDFDADGDALTITSTSSPAYGSVLISAGRLVYTAIQRYVGPVTFTYSIRDGRGAVAAATVNVTVTR
jgi:PKD repeat protein